MRILLLGARTYPARHGGLEVAVQELAQAYASLGHDPMVLVDQSSGVSTLHNIAVHQTKAIRSKYTHSLSQLLFGIPKTRRLGSDVVHVHGVGGSIPLALHPQVFG